MPKTSVYSWRLAPDLKSALEEAAVRQGKSVAELLEGISRDWLSRTTSGDAEEEQRRLHAAASRHFGAIAGGDPERSTEVRETVRARLARRHGRAS